MIITIGRQLGSGGLQIGQLVAKEWGYDFYDKQLITEAARDSGMREDFFTNVDEKANKKLETTYVDIALPESVENLQLPNASLITYYKIIPNSIHFLLAFEKILNISSSNFLPLKVAIKFAFASLYSS